MKTRLFLAIIVVVVVVTIAYAFLRLSAAAFGSWWRIEGMPSPEEWGAVWTAATLATAAAAAWLALAQLRHSAQASLDQARPFVIVDVHFRASVILSIEVKNSGLTAARDIKLDWSAVPAIADEKRRDAFMRNLVNEHIPFLAPGRVIRYFVGRFPDYPKEATRRFVIHASYKGADGFTAWDSESVVDLDQWANALADSDYENKNWNENKRQTKAQQDAAKHMKSVANAIEVLAEFVEIHPTMRNLRATQQSEYYASFGPDLDEQGPHQLPPGGDERTSDVGERDDKD